MSQWLFIAAENGGRPVRRREWMMGWVWGWPQKGGHTELYRFVLGFVDLLLGFPGG